MSKILLKQYKTMKQDINWKVFVNSMKYFLKQNQKTRHQVHTNVKDYLKKHKAKPQLKDIC